MPKAHVVRASVALLLRAGLLLLAVILLSPVAARAAFDDAGFDGAGDVAQISLTTGRYTAIGSVESIEVSDSSFVVNLLAGSSITIYSAGRHTFNVSNPNDAAITFTCLSAESKLRIVGNGTHAVTVTPTGTACETGGSGGGGSGGGGGGGGGGGSPTPAPTPAPTPTSTPTPAPPLAVAPPAQPAPAPVSAFTFASDLKFGDVSEDVRQLQQFLNANGYTVAESGPGSSGNETSKFGPATKRAVAAYQAANSIPTTGYVGPKTRAAMNAAGAAAPAPTPVPVPEAPSFDRDLSMGSTGEDVRELQALLNIDPDTRIADAGPGSPGSETMMFGSATRAAVRKFQAKYGLPQVGRVGPATRAKLAEVLGGGAAPAGAPGTTPAPSAGETQQMLDLQQQIQNLQNLIQQLGGQ